MRLTSANSISLGRLLPQMFYYALRGAAGPEGRRASPFSVPSGNFGNLVAGVMAWRMGAPIDAFVAATTVNDTVPRYLATGGFEPRPSVPTLANAMDVGNPSNFERLQWLFGGDRDGDAAARSTSSVHTDDEVRRRDSASCIDRFMVTSPIRTPPSRYLGATRGEDYGTSARPHLFLATAHPAKFREVVEPVHRRGRAVACRAGRGAGAATNRATSASARRSRELSKLL